MTTKAIRALIERAKREGRAIAGSAVGWPDAGLMANKALLEVDAIEAACAFVVKEDAIADVENEHIDIIKDIAREAGK